MNSEGAISFARGCVLSNIDYYISHYLTLTIEIRHPVFKKILNSVTWYQGGTLHESCEMTGVYLISDVLVCL